VNVRNGWGEREAKTTKSEESVRPWRGDSEEKPSQSEGKVRGNDPKVRRSGSKVRRKSGERHEK
jgi:hypothetical protein